MYWRFSQKGDISINRLELGLLYGHPGKCPVDRYPKWAGGVAEWSTLNDNKWLTVNVIGVFLPFILQA